MHTVFDVLNPKEAAFAVAGVCAAAIIYAVFSGKVFLMPYSVSRSENPRAFYILLLFIALAFIFAFIDILKK